MDELADYEGLDDEYLGDRQPSFPLAVVTVSRRRFRRYTFRVEIVSGVFKGEDRSFWARLPKSDEKRYNKIWDIVSLCIPFEIPESEILSSSLVRAITEDTYIMVKNAQLSASYSVRQLWRSN